MASTLIIRSRLIYFLQPLPRKHEIKGVAFLKSVSIVINPYLHNVPFLGTNANTVEPDQIPQNAAAIMPLLIRVYTIKLKMDSNRDGKIHLGIFSYIS